MKRWMEMDQQELDEFVCAMGVHGADAWENSLSLQSKAHFDRVMYGYESPADHIEAQCNWEWFKAEMH